MLRLLSREIPLFFALALSMVAAVQPIAAAPAPLARLDPDKVPALRVFLDCDRGCDFDFLRREVTYVNYVRDRLDAQVHVLVTFQGSGSGREYRLRFIGLEELEGIDLELEYFSSQTDTSDERRRGFARMLQLGLVRYVLETPLAAGLEISYRAPIEGGAAPTRPQDDPWNYWVYRARANAFLSGEDRRDRESYSGSMTARRTTEAWRIAFGVNGAYNDSTFELEDGEIVRNVTRDSGAGGQLVKSLGGHWGLGVGATARRSTFLNLDLSYRAAAAVEYNLYPYSESSERELTFSYFVGLSRLNFEELTVLEKLEDTVSDQGVIASFAMEQPWGESGVDLEMSHFLDDTDRYRVRLGGRLEYRIFRGFSVNLFGNYSLVRDQIYLPLSEASDEDILLARRALETDSRFNLGVGLSYTFGSIFNNVVNSRFSGSSGGFHRIF